MRRALIKVYKLGSKLKDAGQKRPLGMVFDPRIGMLYLNEGVCFIVRKRNVFLWKIDIIVDMHIVYDNRWRSDVPQEYKDRVREKVKGLKEIIKSKKGE